MRHGSEVKRKCEGTGAHRQWVGRWRGHDSDHGHDRQHARGHWQSTGWPGTVRQGAGSWRGVRTNGQEVSTDNMLFMHEIT